MENKDDKLKEEKAKDELWDKALEDPDSSVFFDNLDKQVDDALSNGEFFEGDFSEDDLK